MVNVASDRILTIVSDHGVRDFLLPAIGRNDHLLRVATTGRGGLADLRKASYDLVLVCMPLSDVDGVEVCRRVRELDPDVGLIALVPEAGEVDGVAALEEGADDYLVRPARERDLQARINAVLRRSRRPLPPGGPGFALDIAARRVRVNGRHLDLTKKEFDLLTVLYLNRGRVVLRTELLDEVWESHWYGSPKALDMHVSSLRRKMAEASSAELIGTVRGVGYRLEIPSTDGSPGGNSEPPGEGRERIDPPVSGG